MSLHTLLAHEVRSRGRGDDTMLIHMTPQEVGGLQALAESYGGSLSINPDTGLPEAGFLKNILPTLIGVGLSFVPGVNALGAGLITGGIQTARTGDIGQGLLAGLGAFGGAGIGNALTSAGSAAAAGTAGTASMGDLAAQQAIDAGMNVAATPTATLPSQMATSQAIDAAIPITGTPASNLASVNLAPPTFGSNAQLAGEGIKALGQPGGFQNFASGLGDALPTTNQKLAATAGLAMPFIPPEPEMEFPEPEDPYANYKGPVKPSEREVRYPSVLDSREFNYFTPSNPIPYAEGGETEDRSIRRPGADYQVNQGEFDYNFRPVEINTSRTLGGGVAGAAPSPIGGKGGLLPEGIEDNVSNRLMLSAVNAIKGGEPNSVVGYTADGSPIYSQNPAAVGGKGGKGGGTAGPAGMSTADRKKYGYDKYTDTSNLVYDPQTQELVRRYAQGGLTAFAKGRFLEGPGDGTSDDIPAVIGNRQPARLADGEFVIDARTVSEIGNGSSKAGAKKLYAMMDRVHNERKKASRGKDSNADKHLPA